MRGITYSKDAVKAMRKLPANTRALITRKLQELAQDPYAMRKVKKLTDRPGYRLRIGNWRVLYSLEEKPNKVIVIHVDPRGGAYK